MRPLWGGSVACGRGVFVRATLLCYIAGLFEPLPDARGHFFAQSEPAFMAQFFGGKGSLIARTFGMDFVQGRNDAAACNVPIVNGIQTCARFGMA